MARKKIPLTVYVDPEQKAAVEGVAVHKRVSVAELVREALDVVIATSQEEHADQTHMLNAIEDYSVILRSPATKPALAQVDRAKRVRWLVREVQVLRGRLEKEEARAQSYRQQMRRIHELSQ